MIFYWKAQLTYYKAAWLRGPSQFQSHGATFIHRWVILTFGKQIVKLDHLLFIAIVCKKLRQMQQFSFYIDQDFCTVDNL